jgi:hypothetical protein
MHVSPFFGLDQTYRFSFTEPGERVHAGVGIVEGGERPFWAELTGRRRPLTDAALARALARYPFMSQQVTGLIHWQAVKLAMKKVPFHPKPRFVPGEGSVATAPPAPEAPPRRALRPQPPATRSPRRRANSTCSAGPALSMPAAGESWCSSTCCKPW